VGSNPTASAISVLCLFDVDYGQGEYAAAMDSGINISSGCGSIFCIGRHTASIREIKT
jgi:hypothetical protein